MSRFFAIFLGVMVGTIIVSVVQGFWSSFKQQRRRRKCINAETHISNPKIHYHSTPCPVCGVW